MVVATKEMEGATCFDINQLSSRQRTRGCWITVSYPRIPSDRSKCLPLGCLPVTVTAGRGPLTSCE